MKAIDDCENDDCVLSGFCHYPHSNNCYMEKEFYETWRKEHGITIEGYQLNKRQLIEMLTDFKNHLLKEQKQIINNQAIRIQSLLDKQIKDACE